VQRPKLVILAIGARIVHQRRWIGNQRNDRAFLLREEDAFAPRIIRFFNGFRETRSIINPARDVLARDLPF
jgi:hypothetical protein